MGSMSMNSSTSKTSSSSFSSTSCPRQQKNKKGEFKFLVNGGAGTEEYIQLVQIFCSDPAGYPARNIAKALHRQKDSISSMFDNNLSLQARAGLDTVTHMENICGMTTKHIMPKAAKNKKGEFKFLVNGGAGTEEYIQLV